jgi:hypothetical protein
MYKTFLGEIAENIDMERVVTAVCQTNTRYATVA